MCGIQLTFVPGSSLRCLQPSWPAGCGTSLDMWDFRRRGTRFPLGYLQVGVSKNRGTPKWMVYNGKPYLNG